LQLSLHYVYLWALAPRRPFAGVSRKCDVVYRAERDRRSHVASSLTASYQRRHYRALRSQICLKSKPATIPPRWLRRRVRVSLATLAIAFAGCPSGRARLQLRLKLRLQLRCRPRRTDLVARSTARDSKKTSCGRCSAQLCASRAHATGRRTLLPRGKSSIAGAVFVGGLADAAKTSNTG